MKRKTREEDIDLSVMQLSTTVCWLIRHIAEVREDKVSDTCKFLTTIVPYPYMVEIMEVVEQKFLNVGL